MSGTLTGLTGLALRGTAAGLVFVTETVAQLLERLADHVDPPPHLTLVPDVRMCDLSPAEKGRAMAADPEGYWQRVNTERLAEALKTRRQ